VAASTLRRLAFIVLGYAVAWGAGALTVWWHDRNLSPADQLAMSGMLAFGDTALFWAVAAPIAIVPTLLVFSLVRARRGFWRVYAFASLFLSFTGLVEACLLLVPMRMPTAVLETLRQASPVRVLAAPVFLLAYSPGLLPTAAPYRRITFMACLFELFTLGSFALWVLLRDWTPLVSGS